MPISTKLRAPKRDRSSRMPWASTPRRSSPSRGGVPPTAATSAATALCSSAVAVRADLVAPAPLARQQPVDHGALVGRRARARQLAPQRVEVRHRVVAEDAGLAPDAARAQAGPLADQHRIALETEAARLEHIRDRKQELARVAAADLDAGKVLAVPPADDARDPVAMVAVLRRGQIDVARAVALDEPRRIILEAKCRRRLPGSAAKGAWIPAPAGNRVIRCIGELRHAGKNVSVATSAALGAGVVAAQDVAADARPRPGRARRDGRARA